MGLSKSSGRYGTSKSDGLEVGGGLGAVLGAYLSVYNIDLREESALG